MLQHAIIPHLLHPYIAPIINNFFVLLDCTFLYKPIHIPYWHSLIKQYIACHHSLIQYLKYFIHKLQQPALFIESNHRSCCRRFIAVIL